MNLSYWEQKSWFSDIDFAIVGSGIVGLSCALALRKKHPKKKIVVFEKGILPSGASTKNAGFACFGSVSEILEDLKTHSEEEVIQIIRGRIEGLKLLRETLGDHEIDYHEYGGYEVFSAADEQLYEKCLSNLPYVNNLMKMAFYAEKGVFIVKNDPFSFKNTQKKLIFNQFEGQINTGMMMQALLKKAAEMDIFVINSVEIESYLPKNGAISIILNKNVEISVKKLLLATNGFAKQLFKEELQPARAQVLITKPIKDLKIKGTFHLEKGYYYFRNIDDRILLGGGRNLDFNAEETTELGLTALVQNKLDELLSTTILPGTAFEIESRWSGIMGVGGKKKPIVKKIDDHVYCGVRLGGMGVAIGSSIGKHMAELVDS
ncbi:MAG: FAD-binding oxidoreductase [Bacteroidia bacterium]|nr:FAD-binding oxidoreductase [Bacteroidia bacterium]NNF31453.1 FAD-binding oxidoreductase [Flavobacteriaceae bacterium]MBT8275528.1 FAD-binding oxidoreductase [Bacteroidia bacterium]NNJ82072.1 FAD-binding oxidoreductase [Flavobacteriaceae bacterium]NNK54032.1 FAD-binding oxidoreductase [Flavobacteriaceae bacterium]